MNTPEPSLSQPPSLNIQEQADRVLLVQIGGDWKIGRDLPSSTPLQNALGAAPVSRLSFDTSALTDWDSGLLTFLLKIAALCRERSIKLDQEGLPEGVSRLLALATAVPPRADARRGAHKTSMLARLGEEVIELWSGALAMLAFLGETSVAMLRCVSGRARFRASSLWEFIQECGPNALPIVTLISVLVGLILAFVGAVQLRLFGAQIYVANLVGLGMAREMGAMMTAIIMAGRTGAAFAAQIGTMQVNEEIDALQTLGISPVEFLVLPRMLALVFMMPLLCLYSDFMGILGGGLIGVGMLDITPSEYYNQTKEAIRLMDFTVGLIKSGVFGVIVALSGCLRGIQCGRSSSAVGLATTSAVVTAIVAIVVADSILTIIYDRLGI